MSALEGSWEHTANVIIDRFLPDECIRPSTPFDLPSSILSDSSCASLCLSRALGIGIILFATLIKLPQISTILSNKSVAGLSITTFLIETFGYTYNLAAHFRQNYPLTTYAEFFVLIAQNYFILYLIYSYNNRSAFGLSVITAYICGLLLLCSPYFPVEIIKLMTLGNVVVVLTGRIPQAYANYANGSTGALSPFTCWGIFLGALVRIFTTLKDVPDFNILAGYLTSATLNGIIAFQVVYYKGRPVKKPEDKTKKAA